MEFYKLTPINDWTCVNVVDYYRSRMQRPEAKKIFDSIKKDLQIVTSADSGFNKTSKKKAQEILDSWKDWAATMKCKPFKCKLKRSKHKLKILEAKQQELATENASSQMDIIQKNFIARSLPNPRKHLSEDQMNDSKALRTSKRKKSFKESDGFDDENGDEVSERMQKTDDTNDKMPNFEEYQAKYLQMHNDKKWKLPSGKYLEDILFNYTKKLLYESPLHSFIVDTSDEDVMELFSDKDRRHIMTYNILPEPQLQDDLIDHVIRYRQTRPKALRKVVNAGINVSPYDPKTHFDYHYVHQVFSQLLPRYELRSEDFTSCHLEGWFQTNIWSIVVDACFIDLKTIEFVRGEGCSRASGERKNDGRKSKDEKKLFGHKCDGIARDTCSPEEYAVSEEGHSWTGKDGTKYLADGGLKLPKLMRDMLHQKIKKYGLNLVRPNQLEIVGFLHSALNLQTLVLDSPSGYVYRLRRYPTTEIPPSLAEVDELIFMVHELLLAKFRIRRCLERLNNANLLSKEDLRMRLKTGKKVI